MSSILLSTLNSTYQHCSFGLRYLQANLGELQQRSEIIEFTIAQSPRVIVETLLLKKPSIIGFGVYIWNTDETLAVVSILKKVAPEITIVLGGPEISYETEGQELTKLADYIIQGEADFQFRELCEMLLVKNETPANKIWSAKLPDIKQIKTPYSLYSDEDIKNRIIYVEVSRGCPYKCEYCLSSLDKLVRSFDLDLFLTEIQILIDKGARQFKFVDRTFNLSIPTSTRILEFFLKQIDLGLFLHFEMVPDRLPEELKELIKKFPAGSLQFEIGIQTFNMDVAKNVSRKNDLTKVAENFKFLREHTHVHSHADLIVGLPGETFESFAEGFDKLVSYDPDEVQVGILKRLKGTPIIRHDGEFKMRYQTFTPFQILSTAHMDFMTLQKMNRFAKFWDLYANSGNFPSLMKFLKKLAVEKNISFFHIFFDLSESLSTKYSETHSISLMNLAQSVYNYLIEKNYVTETEARELIIADYCNGSKKRDLPPFLKYETQPAGPASPKGADLNHRQKRHLNAKPDGASQTVN